MKVRQGGDKIDELLKEAIKTPTGQKAFPALAGLQIQNESSKNLLVNVKETISNTNKHNKTLIIKSLINGLPAAFSEQVLGVSKSQRKRANASPSLDTGVESTKLNVFTQKYASYVHRKKMNRWQEKFCR